LAVFSSKFEKRACQKTENGWFQFISKLSSRNYAKKLKTRSSLLFKKAIKESLHTYLIITIYLQVNLTIQNGKDTSSWQKGS
jgi:hypothetical protein